MRQKPLYFYLYRVVCIYRTEKRLCEHDFRIIIIVSSYLRTREQESTSCPCLLPRQIIVKCEHETFFCSTEKEMLQLT